MRFWGGVDYLETPVRADGIVDAFPLMLILQGAVVMFFSFIGFEDVLNVSEEVKNPKRDIPFGLIGAMILATLIYMAVAEAPANPALQNKLARQAIGYAIDYDGIVNKIMGGAAKQAPPGLATPRFRSRPRPAGAVRHHP